MRKKIAWEWEPLDDFNWRAKVIGGWLVRTRMFIEGKRGVVMSESMVFLADRDHEWTVIPPHSEAQKPPVAGGLELFGKPE